MKRLLNLFRRLWAWLNACPYDNEGCDQPNHPCEQCREDREW